MHFAAERTAGSSMAQTAGTMGQEAMVSKKDVWTQLDPCPRAQLEGCKPKTTGCQQAREQAGQR